MGPARSRRSFREPWRQLLPTIWNRARSLSSLSNFIEKLYLKVGLISDITFHEFQLTELKHLKCFMLSAFAQISQRLKLFGSHIFQLQLWKVNKKGGRNHNGNIEWTERSFPNAISHVIEQDIKQANNANMMRALIQWRHPNKWDVE